ncbi:tetratricopeptide repeat protein [Arcobacter sp.]|uniref:tetratricopeptide repeat protein n=1 Tax=Arcobacter sp. TaxID=1872629 RepID=UPI003D0A367A
MIKFIIIIFLTISLCNSEEISNTLDENKITQQIKDYQDRALNDDPEAYFQLGKIYFEGKYVFKNYEKALEYFSAASHLGHIQGTYNLALFYLSKQTPFHDNKKALSYFLELARKGHAPSQNRIGMYLTSGIILEKDYKEAVKWFEASSKQGYVNAQCNLAFMYASGKGVWQNMGRAHAFAKPGYKKGYKLCKKVWDDFNLEKYPEDKGFKFKFYNEP